MRKFVCLAAFAAVVFSASAFAACAPAEGKRSAYTIEGEYFPEERLLVAEMKAEIVNRTETAFEELDFELWPNAYREGARYSPVSSLYAASAYYGGKSYGGISVTGIDGAENFRVCGEDSNLLAVSLPAPVYPDETATLAISFEVRLAKVNHRLGVTDRGDVNLANFYPVLCPYGAEGFRELVYSSNGDPFVSECADYAVTLTVPEEYALVSGFPAEETAAEGKRTYRVAAENARDVAFVLGKGLKCVTAEADGTEIAYYYASDPAAETTLKAAADSFSYFSETFGAYEYPRYAVVETRFPFGGMEYPALSMISSSLRANERPAVVAHETAHQWWYAMVGSDQFSSAWQDEGLAEYSAALFLGEHPEYGVAYEDAVAGSERSYRAFFSVYSQVNGEANTAMNRPLTDYAGEYEYRNVAYDKGVILFDRLREVMGERRFFRALREYCSAWRGKIASPADLVACFTRTGANVEPLFDSFTEGRVVI